ncbi:MAG: CtsR family transcriptional regulator, partial [Clostridia bacterium]|nr:CtsR family transcriptional regulator [Clostridia bacterium]
FTPEKGFIIESKRGGGGCINLIRINDDKENVLKSIYNYLQEEGSLEYNKLVHILQRLESDGIIADNEKELLKVTMSDKALAMPINMSARLRAQMLKEIILNLSKRS